nr:enoyl-CoA hydratase/isomerase family protein [Nocardia carnea]
MIAQRDHGEIREVLLDRPERRNALSRSMLTEITEAVSALPAGVKAVLLTGAGPVFSAGADFADLTGTSADLAYDRDLEAACTAIRTCAVPVVAVVHGPCIGAGVELATSCDARIVGGAAWFRVPAVELGLLYNPAALRRLHTVLPRATMTRLLVCAERFDARDAVAGGLATHYTDDDPQPVGLGLARSLADLPTEALSATRTLVRHLDEGNYDGAEWERVRVRLMDSRARREAVTSSAFRNTDIAAKTPTMNKDSI